jgi:hypothetical protein
MLTQVTEEQMLMQLFWVFIGFDAGIYISSKDD